jgi:predicted transcriptional regulator
MSVAELQKKLIAKISETNDAVLLEEIFNFMGADEETAAFYKLSESQLATVEASQKQIADGNFFTNEQVNNEIDQWLAK